MTRSLDIVLLGTLLACGGEGPRGGKADPTTDSATSPTDTGAPTAPQSGCYLGSGLICRVAGTGLRGASEDGLPATFTNLFLPSDLTWTPEGLLLIDDYNNNHLRLLGEDGRLRVIAGDGRHAYAIPGELATRSPMENPVSVGYGPDGDLFVMEQHAARILRIDTAGVIHGFAGITDEPGYEGYSGDGGPATEGRLTQSTGLGVDEEGNVYFADARNHAIRWVDTFGTLHTLAGNGEKGDQDGVGPEARFNSPQHLAVRDGALYVADTLNHKIRKIDLATAEVTTVAGDGRPGYFGDDGPALAAQLLAPQGVDVGPDGTVYLADSDNFCVRAVSPEGIIRTFAGQCGVPTTTEDTLGDGGLALEATMGWPVSVRVGPDGRIYVVDMLGSTIRVIG
jgi:DNA-binding beta-propeller fold protein YncE